MFSLAKMSPAFVVSVALYAALAHIDEWMGKPMMPAAVWPEVQDLVALYRENVGDIGPKEMATLHILDLDRAIHDRAKQFYHDALQKALIERIENANQHSADFGDAVSRSFFAAFRELSEVLGELAIDFVPIQGTLISLLRYGSFPAGRLSEGKQDVVDNDAEVMIFLTNEWEFSAVGARLSLALEARGWPPCTNPHARKLVCLSMRHAIPCKLEIYAATKDFEQKVIYMSRQCSAPGQCQYNPTFPLQHWRGQMPLDIMYPLKQCRVGSLPVRTPCPNSPLSLLRGWNKGEYEKQSFVAQSKHANDGPAAPASASKQETSCLALPVVSIDRDMGDKRNQDLNREGLTMLDLHLLHSYARELHKRGFASFYDHLHDPPCVRRQWRIFYGEPLAELSRLS